MAEFHPQELHNIVLFMDKSWISPVKQIWCISRGTSRVTMGLCMSFARLVGGLISKCRSGVGSCNCAGRRRFTWNRCGNKFLSSEQFLLLATLCDVFELCHDCKNRMAKEASRKDQSNRVELWSILKPCIFMYFPYQSQQDRINQWYPESLGWCVAIMHNSSDRWSLRIPKIADSSVRCQERLRLSATADCAGEANQWQVGLKSLLGESKWHCTTPKVL